MALPVFTTIIGLDIGKAAHHAVALDQAGMTRLTQVVPNDEGALTAVFTQVPGPVLVVVDLAASLGTLPISVAQGLGHTVALLPPANMRRMAELLPGTAKTDARDAWVIAEAARQMPITLRVLDAVRGDVAELRLLCGYDADLRADATALSNRLRNLLTQFHPALERVIGPQLQRAGLLELLMVAPTPAALQALGRAGLIAVLRQHHARRPEGFVDQMLAALAAQTVEPAGTAALSEILPRLASQLAAAWQHRTALARQIAALVTTHPLYPIVSSLPGFGPHTTAIFLVETAGKPFATADDLASYAGVAPVPWRSGQSINHVKRAKHGNRRLKDACYQAAFASLATLPASRAYYDRKRAHGHNHVQALLCLARQRIDVLFAMLRDHAPYHPPSASGRGGRMASPAGGPARRAAAPA